MWFRGSGNTFQKFIVLTFALNVFKGCEAITNADFNSQIRDYSASRGNNLNLSDVKTLQKQGLGLSHYANVSPVQNPVKFKRLRSTDVVDTDGGNISAMDHIPDNFPCRICDSTGTRYDDNYDSVISGSNHARGLLHNDHTGYSFDYEDSNFGHGYEYPVHGNHHDPHNYHHYDIHDSGHHHSPGHHHGYGHHKYYDHGLGHKALLWPIAGIALLGAAAALVSNPVLLQLGVVSGKRRRRHIEDIENIAKNSIRKWSQIPTDYKENSNNNVAQKVVKKRMLSKNDFKVDKQVLQSGYGDELQYETVNDPKQYSEEDRRFIPIPLKIKKKT